MDEAANYQDLQINLSNTVIWWQVDKIYSEQRVQTDRYNATVYKDIVRESGTTGTVRDRDGDTLCDPTVLLEDTVLLYCQIIH